MTTPSLAATGLAPTPAPTLADQGRAVIHGVVRRFSYPTESPVVSITLYYALLIGTGALLMYFVPALDRAFQGERLAAMAGQAGLTLGETAAVPAIGFGADVAMLLAVAMVGAFLLMVPASWVYMATRRKKGFDQSVVHTMLLLALSVAGVIVIVRNSVALAFSLAGIVGAVRYRNNLPETRDTLFIFLSIGVGLAAGVGALPAAAALSIVFCYMVLLMVRADYGMCELGRSSTHLLHLPHAVEPDGSDGKGKRARKARNDFNAVLVVRAQGAEQARAVVEPFLDRQTKRWSLAEVETDAHAGRSHLKYLIRLGRRKEATDVEDALLESGAPHVIGARIH